jgi:dienelactone hydrolase
MLLHRAATCVSIAVCVTCSAMVSAEPTRSPQPWDVERIMAAPVEAELGEPNGLVTPVRYRTENYQGRECWVFAYYGRPQGDGPFPAMLLVHGGGGKAFAEWADLWAKRGYVALAMDLAGNGPDGQHLENGGPPQDDEAKFRAFVDEGLKDMWTYQAVAAILRGHALLAARPEVDKQRIGITGISWGGYLTCIVAGIDHQLKVAVPVYGCGYLHENSAWQENGTFDSMPAANRARWLSNFDPSAHLPGVACPILFVNGTNDFAYPLDSYQKSYRLVAAPRNLCVTVNMPHGHSQGWAPAEIGAFVDSVLKDGAPLARLSAPKHEGGALSATYEAHSPIAKAELHYSTDRGRWQDRKWTSVAAAMDEQTKALRVMLPPERPLVAFLTVTDARGLTTSSEHVELGE